jgi:hypothetical protein
LITPLDAALLGAILTLRRIGGRQTQRQPDPATSPQPVKFIFSFKFAKDEFNLNIK